ncbi:ribosomal RNA adenine methyltransferase KsgA/Erm [Gongronella butleri]|nr:ribosomal RNA adenine methyltransferase KsgA/Erm [Gongronella butleri]
MKDMTSLELYPGLGVWTSAVYNGGIHRIYGLEPVKPYLEHLNDWTKPAADSITMLKNDGYNWQTYIDLKDEKYLGSLVDTDWSRPHPRLLFTGMIPKSSIGEQLLAQFATCIINKMALHSFGRVQMALWLPDPLLKKFMSEPGSSARCKMGVVTEACADVSVIHTLDESCVFPHNVYHLVHVTPFTESKLKSDWDVFEYVLRHIAVMPKQSLVKMVRTLGPGADIILGRLSFDPNILVGDMTATQLDEVAIKFDQWPLRPRFLFEDPNTL